MGLIFILSRVKDKRSFFFRENSILKEQLKHYMGAVQMLKNSANNTSTPLISPPPDYHQEAGHFEEKLIQANTEQLNSSYH